MTDLQGLLSQNNHEERSQSPNPQASTSSRTLPWGSPAIYSSRMTDAIWTIIFCVSNSIVLITAIKNMTVGTMCSNRIPLLKICDLSPSAITALIFSALLSVLFGYAWVKLVSQAYATSNIIGLSFSFNLVFWSTVGLAASANGAWYTALISIFCCAVYGLLYFFMRHRLDFTYALLDYSTDCLKTSNYCFKTAVGAQLAMFLYQVIWLIAISGIRSPLFSLFMFLNLIWATNIVISFVFIISGNYLASTFIQGNPIFNSQSPECKFSFGSICFGSLVLTLVQTLRTLAQGSLQSGAPGSCLALCIFGILEYLANFLIRCTFSYVAIWGIELSSAVERTRTLLRSRAIDVFVNSNFSGSIVLASTTIGGIFGAIFGCLVYIVLGGRAHMAEVSVFSYAIGCSTMLLVATLIEGMVDSLMVLWIEAPDLLTAYQSQLDSLSPASNVLRDGHTRLENLISASRNLHLPFHPDSLI